MRMCISRPRPHAQAKARLAVARSASEARCADLFERARDGIHVAGPEGNLTSGNSAMEEIMRFGRAELLAQTGCDLAAPDNRERARGVLGTGARRCPRRPLRVQPIRNDGASSEPQPT